MEMTIEQFERYRAEFNDAADKSTFFDRWYDPDAVFIHPFKGTFRGKEQLVRFWNTDKNSGHSGIQEVLHLEDLISIEGRFAAELRSSGAVSRTPTILERARKAMYSGVNVPPSTS